MTFYTICAVGMMLSMSLHIFRHFMNTGDGVRGPYPPQEEKQEAVCMILTLICCLHAQERHTGALIAGSERKWALGMCICRADLREAGLCLSPLAEERAHKASQPASVLQLNSVQ